MLRLHRAVQWHASSPSEAQDIRRVMGESASVIVRPNETKLPSRSLRPPTSTSAVPRAAFLGRIVPIKGLDLLLRALGGVSGNLSLDIIGPEEDAAYSAVCHRLTDMLPSNITVRFRGPIPHEDAVRALREYDVLLMPTAGENFGQVFAEALSVSVPVMAMDVTPWTATLSNGGGVVVAEPTETAWAKAITNYCSLDDNQRTDLRQSAGAAYDAWYAGRQQGHVFEDLRKALG